MEAAYGELDLQQCIAETQSGVITQRNAHAPNFAAAAVARWLEIQIAPRPCNWRN
jgi:hypothetical protein